MKLLYRIYQLFIGAPLALLSTLWCALTTATGCMFGDAKFWSYWPGKHWGRSMFKLFGIPVTVEGREHLKPGQSYIFICNHQGAYDIFLVYGYLGVPFKWMMKQSLRKIPFVGFACEKAGFTFVDKSSPRALAQTMLHARKSLTDGASMVIFPEGARTHTGKMGEFKRGAFQLASQFKLPICPITIDGAFDVLPRDKGISFVTRHPVRLIIHEPIPPIGKDPEALHQAMTHCREVIMSALPEALRDGKGANQTATAYH